MAGHAGFDSAAYPGDACMAWLKANTNLEWCGYYLGPAPSYSGASWMTQQGALSAAGWELAPIYVGEQVVPPGSQKSVCRKGDSGRRRCGAVARGRWVRARNMRVPGPGRRVVAASALGLYRGLDRCGRGRGLSARLILFPRHRRPGECSAAGRAIWAFKVPTNTAHPAAGPPFRDDDPAGSGYAAAQGWQLDQNGLINVPPAPAGRLQVDLSSALSPNPGAPAAVA